MEMDGIRGREDAMEAAGEALEEREERRRGYLRRLEGLRAMDDVLMRRVLRDNLPLAQRLLRVVTGLGGLLLARATAQYDVRALDGSHSLVLDAFGVGDDGTEYDLEVQRGSDPDPRRLRYHSAVMDVAALPAGAPFSGLPDQWVVFIMERDPFGEGRGSYRFERREAGGAWGLGDGTTLLYVNGAYRGDDELGSLMADLSQSDPGLIVDGLLRERVQYLKGTPEGREEMCDTMEELYREGVRDGVERGAERKLVENVRTVMRKLGCTAEAAMRFLDVPEADRSRYLALV